MCVWVGMYIVSSAKHVPSTGKKKFVSRDAAVGWSGTRLRGGKMASGIWHLAGAGIGVRAEARQGRDRDRAGGRVQGEVVFNLFSG